MHVTLSPRNVILLNGNVFERLGSPEAVVMLFDKVNSVIGINPVPPSRTNAFRLATKTRGRNRLIRVTPFCKHYGITVDRTTAFLNPEVDGDGVLRLDLKETIVVDRRRRPKGR